MRSFEIDHTKLSPGIYKHSVSMLTTTWDIRIKFPNSGDYLSPEVIHTIEHTMAFYLRKIYGNTRIVGVFPMGCQTGFYVLTRFMSSHDLVHAIRTYIQSLKNMDEVPGATRIQCGNYELQDLYRAKKIMDHYDRKYLNFQTVALNYR